MLTTEKKRAAAVAQANANNRLEGLEPDADDIALQQQFIAGEIGIDEMLEQVQAEAAAVGEAS